jgi:hypothetical protein
MSVYIITGKLGAGKTLVTVARIYDYLQKGSRVVTNLNINMLHLATNPESMAYVERIPDYPNSSDLKAIGSGNPTYDEDKNGLLVLDECGTWLNTRSWNGDNDRQHVINWMLHARKLGWDVLLIVQDLQIVDKQIRLALGEHLVSCKRLDRLPLPGLTSLAKLFGFKLRMPQIHLGIVRYGTESQSPIVDRWVYKGKQFYAAYDTKQAFDPYYPHGLYCTLPRKYLETPKPKPLRTTAQTLPLLPLIFAFLAFEKLRLLKRSDWCYVSVA